MYYSTYMYSVILDSQVFPLQISCCIVSREFILDGIYITEFLLVDK